ncbi:hypothetical protein GCM10011390_07880 [Aureimonas endophytica]|uniref:TadE-like domain-containing protein n=1 Tax=Aureimonas endophytica TaxID=2027858 RepID=A0A917E135_9HYPH|nr:TadE/TadG family type IV pilus assembly protein [Aureimonas endophytica]GGD91503.1 hypothetical protein GCM10011390_07880 [Aureimonas endophytica]
MTPPASPAARPPGFARADSGVAATEFALLLPVLLLLAGGILALGFTIDLRMRLTAAVSEAAHLASAEAALANAEGFSRLRDTLNECLHARLGEAASVAVRLNAAADTSRAGRYFCLAADEASWRDAGSTPAPCPDGSPAGRFVTIAVDLPMPPFLATLAGSLLADRMADQATVRVE